MQARFSAFLKPRAAVEYALYRTIVGQLSKGGGDPFAHFSSTVGMATRFYGPPLPEGVMEDDDRDRGIMLAFVNANPGRQFEFVQSQWVNDGNFISQGARTDPIVGRRDLADDYTFPARPVCRRLPGLPDFTLTRGGEHVFLPSLSALRWLAELPPRA